MGIHALETKWADIDVDDENEVEEMINRENYGFESAPDEFGIKNFISYTKNAKGQTIKITKRIKEIKIPRKINKTVYERKNITPFNLNSVAMQGTSIVSQEDIIIEVPKHSHNWNEQDDDYYYTGADIAAARVTRDLKQKFRSLKDDLLDEPTAEVADSGNKYIPPSRKDGDRRQNDQQRDDCTIRVTNLSEDVKEKDLMDLFGSVGRIHRAYLAKDKETQSSKGFAFITYYSKKDALTAINTFNRRGYDNLLLNVEWARPSLKER